MKQLFIAFLFSLFSIFSSAQSITTLRKDSLSFRGLSVVDNQVVWVSGSQGTVGRSIDGGKNWKWIKVPAFEKSDFRDIEAFDINTAVIMAISEPAFILRTTDGGEHWKVVYEDHTPGIFLDAMEFWNDQSGIVIGDPIDNHFFIRRTYNGGKSWEPAPQSYKFVADSGEACFASSGTNLRKLNQSKSVFISGGLSSHIFLPDQKISLPLQKGTTSTGANSIALKNSKKMIVVGGDFLQKNDTTKNCILSVDGGLSWTYPQTTPGGYRSCVEYLSKNTWITCGLNGVDLSIDEGKNWKSISKESFHVVRKAKKGNAVFLAGNGGRIGKLVY